MSGEWCVGHTRQHSRRDKTLEGGGRSYGEDEQRIAVGMSVE